MLDVPVEAHNGHGEGDDLGYKAQGVPGAGGVELDRHGVGLGRLVQEFLVVVVGVHPDGDDGGDGAVVEVAVVERDVVRDPGLAVAGWRII